MDIDHSTGHGNPTWVLLVGVLGSLLSFMLDGIRASEVVDVWHFIPGLVSVAFIAYRWIMDVKDRRARKKEEENGTNDS